VIALIGALAYGQSCSCSVGGGDSALPTGPGPRAGGLSIAANYTAAQLGGEPWQGFDVVDRQGNSMPTMAMPGHVAQTVRLSTGLGLPHGFSASAAVPWTRSHPLFPSDMTGDVDRSFIGDVALTSRWGQRRADLFTGASLGATLPTGKVVTAFDGGGVRGGRGAVGATAGAELIESITHHVDLGASISGVMSLYAADAYTVGPALNAALGAKFWPREQGRVQITSYLTALDQGHDKRGGVALDQTGLAALGLSAGTSWKFWADQNRSASVSIAGQAPLWQSVGDPWLAQNWSLTAGVSILAI
jgi:hypothetical protein